MDECFICFLDVEDLPVVFGCKHFMCSSCFEKYIQASMEKSQKYLLCPFCQTIATINNRSINIPTEILRFRATYQEHPSSFLDEKGKCVIIMFCVIIIFMIFSVVISNHKIAS